MLHLLLAFQLNADGDSWVAPDKVKHFFMGAFVQSVSYSALRAAGAGHGAAIATASGVTAGVSVAKELWDARGHGTPSVRDLVWDAAGAGAATLVLQRSVR